MRIIDAIKAPFLSLEFFPPRDRDSWPLFFEEVEKLKALSPLFVSVTYGAGGSTQDNTLELVKRLKLDMGLEPMAHLTSVGATPDGIRAFLDKLREYGVDNVLALRGDPPRGQENYDFSCGHFKHGSDLVEFIKKHYPDMCVGVAVYPEAHPESPSFRQDLHWTKYKFDAGGDFAVTQLFFDNRIYFDLVERLADMGVNKPVIPGVLPIMSLKSLKFILSLGNSAIPGKFLTALEAAHDNGGDQSVQDLGLHYAAKQVQGLIDGGAPGVHLYTLNKAEACLQIGNNVTL